MQAGRMESGGKSSPLPPSPLPLSLRTISSLLPHQPRSLQKERRRRCFLGEITRFSGLVFPAPRFSLSDLTPHTCPLVMLKPPGQWAGVAEDRSGHRPHPLSPLYPLPCPSRSVSLLPDAPALLPHPSHSWLLCLPGELVPFKFQGEREKGRRGIKHSVPERGKGKIAQGAEAGKANIVPQSSGVVWAQALNPILFENLSG